MKVRPECVTCIIRQSIEAANMVTKDQEIIWRTVHEVLKKIDEISPEQTPAVMTRDIQEIVRKVTGSPDPYKEVKVKSNNAVKKLYPELKNIVNNSNDKLRTLVKLIIAGNIIDFGLYQYLDLKTRIKEVLEKGFDIDEFDKFKEEFNIAKDILYLADNSGEIIFDKIFIEEFSDKKFTYAVKGGPVLNDVTMEDAEWAGINKIAKVISTGVATCGFIEESCNKEFLDNLRDADMIISKGQGNYESLGELCCDNAFFFLRAKCPVVAANLGVQQGAVILMKNNRRQNIRKGLDGKHK